MPPVKLFFRSGQMLLVVVFLWPLTVNATDPEEFMRDAQAYFSKGEYSAAVIQLKNVLLLEPDQPDARLLLGRAYLKLGDGLSAEKELSRALELGIKRDTVLEPLGRAYLMNGRSDAVLQAITPEDGDPASLKVNILVMHGQAHLAKRQLEIADERFTEALKLQADNADALLGKARIVYQRKDRTQAEQLADQALSIESDNVSALTLKGMLLREQGKHQEALPFLQQALEIAPNNVMPRLIKAMSLISLGEIDKALVEIKNVQAHVPHQPLAYYLKALAMYQQQEFQPAQESLQLALQYAPDHLLSHLLTGTIAYQQGSLNLAEKHLHLYWSKAPGNQEASKLLASTMLKLNRPGKAIEILQRDLPLAADDAQYIALLGSAHMSQGDTARGLEYLEQAATLAPDVASIRTRLAIGQLTTGELEQGVSELQAVVDLGQDQLQADVLLVMAHLQHKDYDNAIVAAEALLKKMPDSPVPLNLKGAALLGKGDRDAAKAAFDAALKVQRDFIPAHLNKAQLKLMAGDTAAAREGYQNVLTLDKGNNKALRALANIAERDGQLGEAEHYLKQARRLNPDEIPPALALVEFYHRQDETRQALEMARATAVFHPHNPAVLRMLALSQLKAGENKKAAKTIDELSRVLPESPQSHYLQAMMQLNQQQPDAARENLAQALKLQEDFPAGQLALGRLEIMQKNYTAALAIADKLQQAHPDSGDGYELKGDVHSSRQEYGQAVAVYRQAYDKVPTAPLAHKLFQSRLQAGEGKTVHEDMKQWLLEHPDDKEVRGQLASVQLKLASAYLTAGQQQRAIEAYLKILDYDPDNAIALNNLAWLYQKAGKPDSVKYAERAYSLLPGRPEVISTLGWVLLQNGDVKRGLVLLQEAASKAPHNADIRYYMAVALDKAGRSDEARNELKRLLKNPKTFTEINNARELLDRLGG